MHVSYESYNIQLAEIIATAKAAKCSPCEPPKRVRYLAYSSITYFLWMTSGIEAFTSIIGPTANNNPVLSQSKSSLFSSTSEEIETYIKCSKCTATYPVKKEQLGHKGRRVNCSVCNHSWFQANNKLFTLKEGSEFIPYPETEIAHVKANLENGQRNDPSVFTGESKLYVGNLSYQVTEQDLVWLFSNEAGDVGDVSIITDRETGRSRGFAFITMLTEEGGNKGVAMDGEQFYGRSLQVRRPNQQ